MPRIHRERHRTERIGWMRATVLGANDGIVSTASLVLGVAAANASRTDVLIAGVAGLVAGAMSMAAGEYVSVRSQADTEAADLARERRELATDVDAEHRELAGIYVKRGLEPTLADEVAAQLMAHDPLGAHARDELGISETAECATCTGRAGVGGKFHRGCGTAAAQCAVAAAGSPDPGSRGQFTGVPRSTWRDRRPHRRCTDREGGLARGVLGSAGNGHHGRRGCALRYGSELKR